MQGTWSIGINTVNKVSVHGQGGRSPGDVEFGTPARQSDPASLGPGISAELGKWMPSKGNQILKVNQTKGRLVIGAVLISGPSGPKQTITTETVGHATGLLTEAPLYFAQCALVLYIQPTNIQPHATTSWMESVYLEW